MKIKYLAFLILTIIFVQACQQQDSTIGSKTNPFKGGTDGILIRFAEGAPPDEVFDSGQWTFDVEVILENAGEFTVNRNDVTVKLSGLNPFDFGKTESAFIKTTIQEDILKTEKDSEGNLIEAPEAFVTFPGLTFQDNLVGNQLFPLRADVCYSYQTISQADGCIRQDVLSIDDDAVCQVSEQKTVFNSGAPLHVTQFSQQPSGSDKVRYIFKIEHLGNGRVYLPRSRCPSGRTAENKIHFKIDSNVADLTCNGLIGGSGKQGDINLNNGERVIQCVQQTRSNLDFIDKIEITLDYDYKEFKETDLLIKKSS